MNLQSLVVIVLRVMALDFLLRLAIELTPSLLVFLRVHRGETSGEAALPWVVLVCLFLCAVLLWALALPIAALATKRVPQEVSLGTLTLADCYSVAFLGVGLFYIANGLPLALNWGHYLFKMAASTPGNSWKEQVNFYQVLQAVLPFLVGVLLFAKGRSWAVTLASRHTKSPSANKPGEPG